MNSKSALLIIDREIKNMNKIKNFLDAYDRQLLTAERFIYLVKGLVREGDEHV